MEFAKNVFKHIAEQMLEQLEFIKRGPAPLKRRAREIVVQRFLKPFLPGSMNVCNGIVISTEGESGEIDLIIYDKQAYDLFKPLFAYYPEDSKPVPIEVVYAIVEIESELKEEKKIKKCVKRIKRVKELPKIAYYEQTGAIIKTVKLYGKEWQYFPTLGIVFAFDGNLNKVREIVNQVEADHSLEHRIDLICILREGLIAYYDPKNKLLQFPPEPNSELVCRRGEPEENLRILYLMLTRIFSQAWTRPVRVIDYFKVK